MRVAFFATCLADRFFAEGCADSIRLLRHLGVEVSVPEGQTCCGQPAQNAGYTLEARRMLSHTLEAFGDADHVVLPSGSCTAMLREHLPALPSFELSEFVVRVLGITELGRGLEGRRIAYHHGCHALRGLGLCEEPLTLLRNGGADLVPWANDGECCGFGGLFSVKVPEVSAAMADAKLDALPAADTLTSADGGCLLQLGGRARQRGVALMVRPLASLLWEAIG